MLWYQATLGQGHCCQRFQATKAMALLMATFTKGTTNFMNKTELIKALAKKQPHLTKQDVTLAVDTILAQMEQTLNAKERIEIRGFGTFTARQLSSRILRNPRTGEDLHKPPCTVFRFKPSKELKLKVDKSKNTIPIKETRQKLIPIKVRPFDKAFLGVAEGARGLS